MTYIGGCIFIKNLSHHKFQAFVSRDNGGSDHWHTLTDSFKSGRWGRSGWDAIVFRDEKDTWRKGVYMHIKVYTTIHAFHDIRVEYGRDRCAALSDISMPMPLFPEFGLLDEPGNTDARRRRTFSQPYIGDCVRVGNASSRRFYAFLSGYQGGGSGWCTLTKSFKDGRWNRAGWEVVVCRDAEDTWRKGVCIHVKDATVYVTISGIGDVGIECGGDEVGVTSGRDDILGNEGGGQSAMTEARLALLGSACKKRDDEAETLYDDYQPCAKDSGSKISTDSTGGPRVHQSLPATYIYISVHTAAALLAHPSSRPALPTPRLVPPQSPPPRVRVLDMRAPPYKHLERAHVTGALLAPSYTFSHYSKLRANALTSDTEFTAAIYPPL